jgi:hypothetical protein
MPGYLFPLPTYLIGTITAAVYNVWVRVKSWALFKRDKKRKLPVTLKSSVVQYKQTMNNAVEAGGLLDPYTGDMLAWEQISTWDPKKAKNNPEYAKQFYFMPTIDHIDPYGGALAFEVCSWQVNACKSFLNPQEFIRLCCTVVNHCQTGFKSKDSRPKTAESVPTEKPQSNPLLYFVSMILSFFTPPAVYLLPQFLEGICTQQQYSKWLLVRAKELYKRDRRNDRPCALHSSRSLYRQAIHAAVFAAGLMDPYTGDILAWAKIGTWDATKGNDNHEMFVKEFTLLPTVDHIDPSMEDLHFEICSWLINCCKSGRTPEDFIGICRKVTEYNKRG